MTRAFNLVTECEDIILTVPAKKVGLSQTELEQLAEELEGDGPQITFSSSPRYLCSFDWVEVAVPAAWLLSDEFFHSLTHHYLENIFKAFDRMMLARYTRRKGTPRENVAEIDGFEFSFRCGETVLYGYGARREASIAIEALEAGLRELRKKAADINGQERKEK